MKLRIGLVCGLGAASAAQAGVPSPQISRTSDDTVTWSGYAGGVTNLNFALVGSASAVPEPSAWATMAAGFAGLGWLGFARRRATGSAAA